MILAKTLQWRKRPAASEEPAPDGRKLIAAVIVAALLALITAWYVYKRTGPSRSVLPERPPDFNLLEDKDQRSDAADEGR